MIVWPNIEPRKTQGLRSTEIKKGKVTTKSAAKDSATSNNDDTEWKTKLGQAR